MNKAHFNITKISLLLTSLLWITRELNAVELCEFRSACFIGSALMCDDSQLEYIKPNADCKEFDCDCTHGPTSKSPIEINMTNKTIGKLSISFRIVGDRIKEAESDVILYVNNKVNEKECVIDERKNFEPLMRRKLTLNNSCNCNEAKDTIVVNFTYLHTACYQVEVRHAFNVRTYKDKSVVSCPRFFTTDVYPIDTQKLITGKAAVGCQLLEKQTLLIIIQPQIKGSTDPDQYLSFLVDRNNVHSPPIYPNRSNFRVAEDGKLIYHYDPLKPGNYCHGVRHMDGRCLLDDTCEDYCIWKHQITVTETQPVLGITSDAVADASEAGTRKLLLLFPITIVIIGSLLAILICFYTVKRNPRFSSSWLRASTNNIGNYESLPASPILLSDLTRKKILLLYPRDCRLFMEAMVKLRLILVRNGFKVFDVWDPVLTEKIRSDPMAVLQSEFTDERTTTILVESECSILIYDQYKNNMKVLYEEPQEFDSLFLYGLQNVIGDLQRKCFVVRLSHQPPDDRFVHFHTFGISTLVRYILPLHLERLILNIQRAGAIDDQALKLNGTQEIKQFRRLVEELSEYKIQNPGYLQDQLFSFIPGDHV